MCSDRACSKPDAKCLYAALRIELPGRAGGYCARRLVIDHGVNAGSHTSSGPTSTTRGDTGATDEETWWYSNPRMSSYCAVGWGLFIVGSVEESGFVITVTFLKILWHAKVSWGWKERDGRTGVWDTLEHLG